MYVRRRTQVSWESFQNMMRSHGCPSLSVDIDGYAWASRSQIGPLMIASKRYDRQDVHKIPCRGKPENSRTNWKAPKLLEQTGPKKGPLTNTGPEKRVAGRP